MVSGGTADLLGSLVGTLESISEVIQHMTEQLRLLGERLLHSHDALLLLHHFFLYPQGPLYSPHSSTALPFAKTTGL